MKIALLGIGNTLLRDEGVGVHAVRKIREVYSFTPHVEIIDGGTLGLDLLSHLDNQGKVLVIDAADFGMEPGFVDILDRKALHALYGGISGTEPNGRVLTSAGGRLSVHNFVLSDLFFALTVTRSAVPDVYLVGVQPGSTEVGLELTKAVADAMTTIVGKALRLLAECWAWGSSRFDHYE